MRARTCKYQLQYTFATRLGAVNGTYHCQLTHLLAIPTTSTYEIMGRKGKVYIVEVLKPLVNVRPDTTLAEYLAIIVIVE